MLQREVKNITYNIFLFKVCNIFYNFRSDLLRAIEYFIMNESYKLDYILIETNGLADPSSVIFFLLFVNIIL